MPPVAKEKKKILLIEDEEIILGLLEKKLTAAGYEVETAKNGLEGLELVEKSKPDLVLLDMLLPGMDGFAVLERMKMEGLLPKIPVVIISNSGQPVEIERAMKLGVRDYLIKVNFAPEEVLERARKVLGEESKEKPERKEMPRGEEGSHVLVVEDDLFILELLSDKLRQSNFRVSIANDTQAASKILQEQKVDLILLDIVLPGVDGFTYLKELKTSDAWREIPVIVLSNLGQKEEIERGMSLGAADYIIKANNSPAEIVKRIEQVLKK